MTTSSKPESQQEKKGKLQSKFLSTLPPRDQAHVLGLTAALAKPLGKWVEECKQDGEPLMRAIRIPQICLTIAAAAAPTPPTPPTRTAAPTLNGQAAPTLEKAAASVEAEKAELAIAAAAASTYANDVPYLLPCVKLATWIFAVDDLTDAGVVSNDETWRRITDCLDVFSKDKDALQETDALRKGLADIREKLKDLRHFSTLKSDLVKSMQMLLDAMRREQEWSTRYLNRTDHPLPEYSEYLENGLWSIGVVPILFGSLMGMELVDVSARKSSERQRPTLPRLEDLKRTDVKVPRPNDVPAPALTELEIEAATCVRLANDLRSYEKEVKEGKLNALTILQHRFKGEGLTQEAALERARTEVEKEIKARLGRMKNELLSPEPTRSEVFRLWLAHFACDFYVHHDYDHSVAQGNG